MKIGDKVRLLEDVGSMKKGEVYTVSDVYLDRVYVEDRFLLLSGEYELTDYDWREEACKNITALLPPAEDLVKPERYNKRGKLECWDVILDQDMGFLAGNILKYLWRYKEKNGLADLKKARVYLDKLIAEEEKK